MWREAHVWIRLIGLVAVSKELHVAFVIIFMQLEPFLLNSFGYSRALSHNLFDALSQFSSRTVSAVGGSLAVIQSIWDILSEG